MSLVFDIETEPLPDNELARVADAFDPASIQHPGEFNDSSVKLGNVKDPAKIREKIEAARAAHAKSVADHDETVRKAAIAHWDGILGKATLDATLSRVCAIGYMNAEGKQVIQTSLDSDELTMLNFAWGAFSKLRKEGRNAIGHYSNLFDVPYMVRRSYLIGVKVPDWVFTPTGYLHSMFIDTMQVWQAGNRRDSISLDRLARAFGISGKPDNCTGATFWMQLRGEGADREAAIEYLRNDLSMVHGVAKAMGRI